MEAAGTNSVSFLQWAFHPCTTPALVCSYNTMWLENPVFTKKGICSVSFGSSGLHCKGVLKWGGQACNLLQKLPLIWSSSLLQLELKELASTTAPHQVHYGWQRLESLKQVGQNNSRTKMLLGPTHRGQRSYSLRPNTVASVLETLLQTSIKITSHINIQIFLLIKGSRSY